MRKTLFFVFACCVFAAACGFKPDISGNSNASANTNTSLNTNAPVKTVAPVMTNTPPTIKPAVAVEYANACKVENDKKTVEITGILYRGESCGDMGGYKQCLYRLKENAADKKGIIANIVQGDAANQAEGFPQNDKDVKIHGADGSIIPYGSKMKITADMGISPDGSYCSMSVTKIEKQ